MAWIEHSDLSIMGMFLIKNCRDVFYANSERDLERLLVEKEIDNLDYIEGLVILREKIKYFERVRQYD